jgi:probable HAF family extracellular repeat protein
MFQCRCLTGLAVTATLAFATTGVQAELRYRIQELTYEGHTGPSDFFDPHAINNRGEVVGYVQQKVEHEWVEYLWTAHVSRGTRLVPLSGTGAFHESNASDINDRGQIVGEFRMPDSAWQTPYLYTHGQYKDLRVENKNSWDYATGINASGQVVGRADGKAFFFDGTRSRYIDIADAVGSHAQALNDHGAVVGNATFNGVGGFEDRAFVYDGQAVKFLENPIPGGRTPTMVDINNAGQMVGHVFNPDGQRYTSFLYGADGKFTDLGSLSGLPGGSTAQALNDRGWVVGRSTGACDVYTCDEAFIYRDGRMLSLNALLSPGDAQQWRLVDARAINERGQIVGSGFLHGDYYSAFLLTPVPEPQSWALLLAGLGVVGTAARRRQAGGG